MGKEARRGIPAIARKMKKLDAKISDTSQAPKGKEYFYRCAACGGVIPSTPRDNVGCECGNIFIDLDYLRLAVKDYTKFEVLQAGREDK
jgi:hypothetical protein